MNCRAGILPIDHTEMDYVVFGRGRKPLVMLPGLGEGLKTIKGMALPLAFLYRRYAADYRVYIFGRRRQLPDRFTAAAMAEDVNFAMDRLGIAQADVIGVSQGGMIAQCLAVAHPEKLRRLVLAVTLARQNEVVQAVIRRWIELAKIGDYKALLIDTAEKNYSDRYLRKARPFFPLAARISRPKDFSRFICEANACLTHDVYDRLGQIACPTLVIGGTADQVVGASASVELANAVTGSELYLYEGLGHGAYEEAKDFNARVLCFLRR